MRACGACEGLTVLRRLTAQDVPTNCTLAYVVPQFVAVAEAVHSGLLQARTHGVDPTRWRSVVTDMCARWENAPEFEAQAATEKMVTFVRECVTQVRQLESLLPLT